MCREISHDMIEIVLILISAFTLGSVPTAVLVAWATRGVDIRRAGSGNPGALNAYRQLGKTAGIAVCCSRTPEKAPLIYLGQRLDAPMSALRAAVVLASPHWATTSRLSSDSEEGREDLSYSESQP